MITQPMLFHFIYFVIINIVIVLFGYIILKKQWVLCSWLMMTAGIFIIHLIFLYEIPVLRMLAIIATTFTCMKVIAATEDYKSKPMTLKFISWLAFAIGWAGMRAQPFEALGSPALPNAWKMIRFGISRVIPGFGFIVLARWIASFEINYTLMHIIVSGLLLVGLSLILHFGLLSISAGMWRLSGVNTYYLFKSPAKALSLSEFWSKRWNLAFSEMISITIFRPLKNLMGSAGALMLAFIFSGLLHELALSVPVNSGYGLPMLYFIIHGALVLVEKAFISNRVMLLQNKVIARIWVFFWLIIPAPLLFHSEFIRTIVWPIIQLKF
jgi:hypothetical protein